MKQSNFMVISLFAGFSLFVMFFGSGNLIFPVWLGSESYDHYISSFIGFFITAIIIPFTGVFSMILKNGSRDKYFNKIGKIPALILLILIMCLIGPFGVIPRCIVISFTGAELLSDSITLPIYSALFCIASGIMIWNHHYLISIIGKWFSPILFIMLIAIIIFGIINAPDIVPSNEIINTEYIFKGLILGYQTMDLLAAVFFTMTTVEYIYNRCNNDAAKVKKISFATCIIASIIFVVIYFCFIYLGAHYAHVLKGCAKEKMLVIIALQTIGKYALYLVGITLIITCFTTGIVLAMLFAEFIGEKINIRLFNRHVMIIITLLISFIMTLIDFEIIFNMLATILSVLYPGMIGLAIGNIIESLTHRKNISVFLFYSSIAITTVMSFF